MGHVVWSRTSPSASAFPDFEDRKRPPIAAAIDRIEGRAAASVAERHGSGQGVGDAEIRSRGFARIVIFQNEDEIIPRHDQFGLVELAGKCIAQWQQFLQSKGLLQQ